MSKAKTFELTATMIRKARALAKIKGMDLSDKRTLPTTPKKAAKLAAIETGVVAGIFKARAAAHIIAVGAGEYTAKDLFTAMRCNRSKQELSDETGSDSLYDDIRFIRNAALGFIVSGAMPDSNEARRVSVDTGEVRPPRKPSPRKAQGATSTKSGGATPSEVTLANQTGARVTTDNDGAVIDIRQVKPRELMNKVSQNSLAAWGANIINEALVMSHSNDADARSLALDSLLGYVNKMASEVTK